jgi:hypothetical protein
MTTDTRYLQDGTSYTEVEVLLDLHTLACGGCGANTVAATAYKRRARGERKAQTLRSAYCTTCHRAGPLVGIEAWQGWQAAADALGCVEAPVALGHHPLMGALIGGRV